MTDHSLLIDCDTLAAHLDDPGWRVLDCRFSLAVPGAGEAAYAEGHVPGAVFAHLERDLAGPITPQSGRHPLPDPGAFTTRLGAWGIDNDTQVVVYDDASGAFASRTWWMLSHWFGHRRVALLDGGIEAWIAQGRPLSTTVPKPARCSYTPHITRAAWTTADEVRTALDAGGIRLIDARAPDRFRGENEPIDPVSGHVPGALNRPFQFNLDENGHFLPAHMLRAEFEELLAGRSAASAVHMCGSGVTACLNLLAMEVAGLDGGRLYAGSWSDWIRDASRPVTTDA
ncbi:MAG: sulfurtransferase [Ectothiorhodospiraceae bacterium]|jgi:thiosulfate/3-mercaptopyruvate sulfurtransferase|nr:sulfurtransferase [Ectothiorhodospiraceae bacterium]